MAFETIKKLIPISILFKEHRKPSYACSVELGSIFLSPLDPGTVVSSCYRLDALHLSSSSYFENLGPNVIVLGGL